MENPTLGPSKPLHRELQRNYQNETLTSYGLQLIRKNINRARYVREDNPGNSRHGKVESQPCISCDPLQCPTDLRRHSRVACGTGLLLVERSGSFNNLPLPTLTFPAKLATLVPELSVSFPRGYSTSPHKPADSDHLRAADDKYRKVGDTANFIVGGFCKQITAAEEEEEENKREKGSLKVVGIVLTFAWRKSGKPFWKKLSTPERYSNLDLPVIGSLVYCESNILDHAANEAGHSDLLFPCCPRFAVFALGSSAYPNFCAFGKYVDNLLGELGGERLLKLAQGDEMCGQEQAFRKWAPEVFRVACETFCLDDDDTFLEATIALKSPTLSASTVRFMETKAEPMDAALSKCHNKKVSTCNVAGAFNLHGDNASRATMLIHISTELPYLPGDHVGVFASNRPEMVEGILARLQSPGDLNVPVELQIMKETHTSNGVVKTWEPHERLPACSLRTLFTKFLDITTPPDPNLLQHFSSVATDPEEQQRLRLLATATAFEDWRHWRFPHLLEVLEEFPSVRPSAALLAAQLSPLQPRFYSISSSPMVHPGQIHITVAVVTYRTQGMRKAQFRGSVPPFMWKKRGKQFRENTSNAPDRDLNPYIPVIIILGIFRV
ncbi:unnamed protein product [Timema podura]|uniref:nitric-oxide synthase (NADPH) n=1 Tax=Timema podura TaxID=61482 RepID=A0ABN7NQL9_TIMPD|nr:unnamed protein product [Timema podura]